jgi:hypothetical protein
MLAQIMLQGLPETVSLTLVAIVLTGTRLPAVKFLFLVLFMLALVGILRSLPLTFGFHLLVGIAGLGLGLAFLTRTPIARTMLSSASAYLILLTFEVSIHLVLTNVLGIKVDDIIDKNWLWIIMGWPQIIAMFFTAYLLRKKDITIKI